MNVEGLLSEIGARFWAWAEDKDIEQVRFELRAQSLADKVLIGKISQDEAGKMAEAINANGEFPGRDLRAAMLRSYVDVQIRNDPKEYYPVELK